MNRLPDRTEVLLEKAAGDARMLTQLAADPESPNWGVGFHAQQSVEKALKAVLASHAIEYPRTHNIAFLLDLLHTNNIDGPPDPERLPHLTPYGVVFRYDDEIEPDPADEPLDREWVRACVRRTLQWAEAQLS